MQTQDTTGGVALCTLSELTVLSMHHDILSRVIVINLLLIYNNNQRKHSTMHASLADIYPGDRVDLN